MRKSNLRLVIDTNLWISFLISNRLDELTQLIAAGKVTILFSVELVEEILKVAERPKMRKYFPLNDIYALVAMIDVYGEIVEVKSNVTLCRDSKDNFLLNLAIDGKADYLITGDDDLLTIVQIKKTKIIKYSDFVTKIAFKK